MSIGKQESVTVMGRLGAVWGIAGITLLFLSALYRLYPFALHMADNGLQWYHWVGLAVCLVFMGYAEGYKGFHLRFSPRAAARARYLRGHPTFIRVLFAPFFCMGFFHATRKRKIVSYAITTMVISLIVMVRHLDQPWRGIVDAGVLFGLGWGVVSVWIFAVQALTRSEYDVSPETPDY
ncbi:MAG: hypothetical protein JXR25_12090 [Pontiellaceae bacterium]|nr:hypothetical protein [Pontiellaceae bacterium]MBN2785554.1 hypothetical protein [Pontiellaceae bacterium]